MATETLAAVLVEQGRLQSWLAGRLGVSRGFMSLVVTGQRTVDREQGERIAAAVGVPFSVLFELRERSFEDPSPEGAA